MVFAYGYIGNYYHQGRVRQQELTTSCATLGIRQSNVFVLDHRYSSCTLCAIFASVLYMSRHCAVFELLIYGILHVL